MAERNIGRAIFGASFLLVLTISLIFLYAQSFTSSGIFPQDTVKWNLILTGYLVIFAISFAVGIVLVPDVVKALATANYWKSFGLKFIPRAIFYTFVLILVKGIIKGPGSIDLFSAITYMSFSVLLIHLLVVTQVEEILFGGLIYEGIKKKGGDRTANLVTIVLFSLFHFAKSGGSWIIMLTYAPLRYWFNYEKNNGTPYLSKIFPTLFGPTPKTQQANAGTHFAWNLFVIGFIEPFRI